MKAKAPAWVRAYKARIAAGQEHCRACGRTDGRLALAPIRPGAKTRDNTTVLCPTHAPMTLPLPVWRGRLVSLQLEETRAAA